jgi:O-antigen chain-terminating bifunctional methyltransferase/kinase
VAATDRSLPPGSPGAYRSAAGRHSMPPMPPVPAPADGSADPTAQLLALVAELPEIYQPIYGHPGVQGARTSDTDRIDLVLRTATTVAALVGRPLRILDLGTAQGYVAFRLAEAGHAVVGVEALDRNVAVARAIAGLHPELDVEIVEADIVDCPTVVDLAGFDLVLGLSVLHHVIERDGHDRAVALVSALARHVPHGIFEMALASEPVFWAPSLPDDPRVTLAPFAFVREIGRSGTHLSDVHRPVLLASTTHVLTGAGLREIRSWSDQAHRDSINPGLRRHYLVGDDVVKVAARFVDGGDDDAIAVYQGELRNEAHVLELLDSSDLDAPRLVEFVDGAAETLLVRSSYPGVLLSVAAPSLDDGQRALVTGQVLDSLAGLEALGLFHADLRLWNVIWDAVAGRAHLIDYGAVRTAPTDVLWPFDAYFSLLVWLVSLWGPFADEVGARLPRTSRIDELEHPPRVAALIARLLVHPRDGHVLRDLARAWTEDTDPAAGLDGLVPVVWRWLGTLEAQRTEALARYLDHVEATDAERAGWDAERAGWDAERAGLIAEHDAWLAERAELHEALATTAREHAALQQAHADLAAELEEARAGRTAAEDEMAKLHATLSWRVTRPLRGLWPPRP